MSANLDLVRSIYAALERGDWDSVEWADPAMEFVVRDGPSPGRWTGPAGVSAGWRAVIDAGEDFRVAADGYRELDAERVLVLTRVSGRGKTSRLELGRMQAKGAAVHHVGGRKVTRSVMYFDRVRALADLGLTPEGDSSGS